jgi:mRNA-degrading endonuclease RelE of RelBE toxin-antitoxin system
MFELIFSDSALDDLRYFKKNEQIIILETIARQLVPDPLTPTRNRKQLRPNDLARWEMRIDRFRGFYDVEDLEDERRVILIKAVGWKDHNTLYLRGREFKL